MVSVPTFGPNGMNVKGDRKTSWGLLAAGGVLEEVCVLFLPPLTLTLTHRDAILHICNNNRTQG